MLTEHPEGYRIPQGGRKNSAEGRSPFLSRSLFFTTVAPLKYSFPTRSVQRCIVVGTFTLPRRTSPSAHREFSGALEMGEGGEKGYIGSKGRGGNLV